MYIYIYTHTTHSHCTPLSFHTLTLHTSLSTHTHTAHLSLHTHSHTLSPTVLETSFTSLDLESANANPVTAQQGQPLSISCGGYTSVPNSPLEWDIYATPLIRLDSVLDRAIVGINGELYFQDPFPDNERVFQCSVQNSVSGVNRNGYVKLIVESKSLLFIL